MYWPTNVQIISAVAVIAVTGWAVIEGVVWVISHLAWR